jgi:hypothetical protein
MPADALQTIIAILRTEGIAISGNVTPTVFNDGSKTVATAITPEKVSATSVSCKSLVITPLSTNTGAIYWGYTTLAPNYIAGQLILTSPSVADLSNIYIRVSVNGEGYTYSYNN